MAFIRTVLGDIAPAELGVCYAHEHIIIDPSFATENEPDFLLDDVEKAVAELKELKAMGVGAVVDSMPSDCGANFYKLVEVSRQSGVHIVAPTGHHLAKYYPLIDQVELDALDWQDWELLFRVEIKGSRKIKTQFRGVRAGLVKIAALQCWDEATQTVFKAAAKSQKSTGAPILTHTEAGHFALEQALFLKQHGADLSHVVLSHLDRNPAPNYHREVLRTGVTIEYDSHFRTKQQPNPTLELLKTLLPEFPDQIVLGMDAARRSYWKSYGGSPGLGYLYGDFRTQMRAAGISDELIHKVFVATPARVYSFKEKS